jgi:hypothetical protein
MYKKENKNVGGSTRRGKGDQRSPSQIVDVSESMSTILIGKRLAASHFDARKQPGIAQPLKLAA